MRKVLLLLGVLCCCAAADAVAGPNAGGVLWVHNTGKAFTAAPVFDPDPTVCPTGINTLMPLWDGVTPAVPVSMYWKVYAAFPAGSSPRLKSVGWGAQFPEAATSPTSYVSVTNGDRVPPETSATVFFIGGNGFPTVSGGTIGQSFPPGARTTLVTPLFVFWGWGYGHTPDYPTWCTVAKTGDDNFGDDNIPANTDQIAGYGCLGFGRPGTVPCPPARGACCYGVDGYSYCVIQNQTDCRPPLWTWYGVGVPCIPDPCPPPSWGACCFPDGTCYVTVQEACSLHWLGLGVPCNVQTCPPPVILTGACCNVALGTPDCHITTQAACLAPHTWLGVDVPCNVETCPAPINATGACCGFGDCAVTTQAACLAPYTWLGVDVPCDWQTCPSPEMPTGACCNTAIGFPACNITTAVACAGLGAPWVYLGDNVPCNAGTCALPAPSEGACCWLDGHCTLTTQADCLGDGTPRWTSGGLCSPNLCDQPPLVTGACCTLFAGYPICTITTQAGCPASGWWLGANVPCDYVTCPVPNPVERSSWGQIKNNYR
jgi:hypothetical protein